MKFQSVLVCGIIGLLLSACAAAPSSTPAEAGKLRIVTTVSPITNIAYNIAGDKADVVGIVPEGVNSHTFEPAPSDAKKLAEADIIFINGLKLEEPTLKLAEANKKQDAEIVLVGEQTITPEGAAIFAMSLQRIAQLSGLPMRQRNWRHGPIAWRIQHVLMLGAARAPRAGIDRLVRRIKLALWAATALSAALVLF